MSLEFSFHNIRYFQAADRLRSSQRAVRTGLSSSVFAFLPRVRAGSISWQGERGCCNLVKRCLAEKVLAPTIWEYTFIMLRFWQPGEVLDCDLVPHLQGWVMGKWFGRWLRCPGQFCRGYLLLGLSRGYAGVQSCPTATSPLMSCELPSGCWKLITEQIRWCHHISFYLEVTVVFHIPHGGSCW